MGLSKRNQAIAISLTIVIYVIHLGFNALAGGLTNVIPGLFPRSVSNASNIFQLQATPSGATFSIWGLIFTYQLIWQIYIAVCCCRKGSATSILGGTFYVTFNLNIALTITWLLVWTRLEKILSFFALGVGTIMTNIAIGAVSKSIHDFVQRNKITSENKADIWCHRILVQNGLLFYTTWTTVATLINTGVVLVYKMGITNETASLMILAFLGVLAVLYFVLENFVINKYLEYTITPYITLIWALSGVVSASYGKHVAVSYLAIALLVLSIIFFIARIAILAVRNTKTSSNQNKKEYEFV